MTYEAFWHSLTTIYPTGEAKAIAQMVMELRFGLTLSDLLCGKMDTLDEGELLSIQRRLLTGEPAQYVIGMAEFGGRLYKVTPDVLIPRPETYELCQWALEHQNAQRILDICTGSGCIACTLATERPDAEVIAWDISEKALSVAQENALISHVNITLEKQDALLLSTTFNHLSTNFNLIISNPPYICEKESVTMERNVIDFEPHIALFVPDNDPLLFYRSIALYALKALSSDGWLLFEINPIYADETKAMLHTTGFKNVEIRQDQFGKVRFIRACR